MSKYINNEKLTDEVIERFVNSCGLELIRSTVDDYTGKTVAIEPIERMEDMIMVKCKNVQMSEMAAQVLVKFPMFGLFNTGAYSMGDEIVVLEDFFASRFKISDEMDELDEKLFLEYNKTMTKLFGKEYEQDAKKCFDEILTQSENKIIEKGE